MVLDAARGASGLGMLVNLLFPEFQPTEKEEEFSYEYGDVLSYLLKERAGYCHEACLGIGYFMKHYVEGFIFKYFDEFMERAKNLGLISCRNEWVSLTGRGIHLTKYYLETRQMI